MSSSGRASIARLGFEYIKPKPLPGFARLGRWDTCPYVVRGDALGCFGD